MPYNSDTGLAPIVWSADGKKILLQGNGEIIDVGTGGYSPLPPQPVKGHVDSFSRSTSGNQIIYEEDFGWPTDNTIQRIVIIPERGDPFYFPGGRFWLSPDGELIGIPGRLNDNSFGFDIFTVVQLSTGKSVIYKPGDDFHFIEDEAWALDGTKLLISDNYYIYILKIQRNEVGEPVSIAETNRIQYCGIVIKEGCNFLHEGLALTADGQYLVAGNDYKLWVIRIDNLEGYLLPIE